MFVQYPCGCIGIRLDAEHVVEVVDCIDSSMVLCRMQPEKKYLHVENRTPVPMKIVEELIAKISTKIADGERWEAVASIVKQAIK